MTDICSAVCLIIIFMSGTNQNLLIRIWKKRNKISDIFHFYMAEADKEISIMLNYIAESTSNHARLLRKLV